MTKKQRVDAVEWLTSVIDLLEMHDWSIDEYQMYNELQVLRSEHTESLIFEHPSLKTSKGHVRFVPFCDARNQTQLIAFLRNEFPTCFRRIDLYGLYSFVFADIDELLFTKKIAIVDNSTQSLCALPPTPCTLLFAELREMWMQHVGFNGESFT